MATTAYPTNKMQSALFGSSSKEEKNKIPKEAVLYIFRPETQYTCSVCVFAKNKSTKCAWFGPKEEIKPYGSCGFWGHMDPKNEQTPEIPWLGIVTKEQAGYDENKNGFSCKRCEYWGIKDLSCEKVNRFSAGDTPGIIHPNACCNRWEADDKRAQMTTEQINNFLGKQ